jgi:orotidine-5'-phosphate decarboxylase
MGDGFGVRLQERIRALGPLCVGVDPSAALVTSWGRNDSVEGIEFFALAVLDAVVGTAAAIKPQVAFFERFGGLPRVGATPARGSRRRCPRGR